MAIIIRIILLTIISTTALKSQCDCRNDCYFSVENGHYGNYIQSDNGSVTTFNPYPDSESAGYLYKADNSYLLETGNALCDINAYGQSYHLQDNNLGFTITSITVLGGAIPVNIYQPHFSQNNNIDGREITAALAQWVNQFPNSNVYEENTGYPFYEDCTGKSATYTIMVRPCEYGRIEGFTIETTGFGQAEYIVLPVQNPN